MRYGYLSVGVKGGQGERAEARGEWEGARLPFMPQGKSVGHLGRELGLSHERTLSAEGAERVGHPF